MISARIVAFAVIVATIGFFSYFLFDEKSSVIILKFGHDMPEDSPQHQGALRFKQIVEKQSNGKLQIEISPSQELGTDAQMILAVRNGSLAISLPPTSKLTTLVPELKIFDIPFLFADKAQLYRAIDGNFGRKLLSKLENIGFIAPVFWEGGFKQITSSKKIQAPQDVIGMKFRVMRSQILRDQVLSLGAFPISTDFHQINRAIDTGSIDAQENPINSIFSMNIFKHHSHLLKSDHGYLAQVLIFSKKIMATLSEKSQKILFNAAKKASVFQRIKVDEFEQRNLKIIEDSGVMVSNLDRDKEMKFVQAFSSIYYEHKENLKRIGSYINPLILEHISPKIVLG